MVIASPNKALFVVPERKFSQENRDLERFHLLVFMCVQVFCLIGLPLILSSQKKS